MPMASSASAFFAMLVLSAFVAQIDGFHVPTTGFVGRGAQEFRYHVENVPCIHCQRD